MSRLSVVMIGIDDIRLRPSGLNRYVADLTAALIDSGIAVTVILPGSRAGPDRPGAAPVRAAIRALRVALSSRQAIDNADVIDGHFALYTLLPIVFASRKPLVVHFHGSWTREYLIEMRLQRRFSGYLRYIIERLVYRHAVRLVTVSSAFKDQLVQSFGVDPTRVDVIPPGVNHDVFSPAFGTPLSPGLALGATEPIVLAVRRLTPRTGVDVLIRAWRIVWPEIGGTLIIAGDGPQARELKNLVSELKLDDGVCWVGRVRDIDLVRLYQASTVSVMPSIAEEGFGLSALESLCCGTPVIASDLGGLSELIRPLDPSLLVPPNNVDALSDRIASLIDGSRPGPTRMECAEYARKFSWSATALEHQRIYEALWQN